MIFINSTSIPLDFVGVEVGVVDVVVFGALGVGVIIVGVVSFRVVNVVPVVVVVGCGSYCDCWCGGCWG